jgi:hypothetical protein
MSSVTVVHGSLRFDYTGRRFTIPRPLEPTWYFVTLSAYEHDAATCQVSHDFVGNDNHFYIGAIQALPDGGSTNVLAGGWPAPQTWIVGD